MAFPRRDCLTGHSPKTPNICPGAGVLTLAVAGMLRGSASEPKWTASYFVAMPPFLPFAMVSSLFSGGKGGLIGGGYCLPVCFFYWNMCLVYIVCLDYICIDCSYIFLLTVS